MSESRTSASPVPASGRAAASVESVEPRAPGGHSESEPLRAQGALPAVPGAPPVTSAVPVPAEPFGTVLPGVQLSQRPRRKGDTFGWPSNAAPGKPEGEVDTRP